MHAIRCNFSRKSAVSSHLATWNSMLIPFCSKHTSLTSRLIYIRHSPLLGRVEGRRGSESLNFRGLGNILHRRTFERDTSRLERARKKRVSHSRERTREFVNRSLIPAENSLYKYVIRRSLCVTKSKKIATHRGSSASGVVCPTREGGAKVFETHDLCTR